MKLSLRSTLFFAASCAVFSVPVVARMSSEMGSWRLFPAAALAALLTAAALWWLVLARRSRYTTRRGIVTGVIVGVLSHPVTFGLAFTLFRVCFRADGDCASAPGLDPAGTVNALLAAAIYSVLSLTLVWWWTMGVGAFLGGLIARWARRQLPPVTAFTVSQESR
jgi:hypothetical protein